MPYQKIFSSKAAMQSSGHVRSEVRTFNYLYADVLKEKVEYPKTHTKKLVISCDI